MSFFCVSLRRRTRHRERAATLPVRSDPRRLRWASVPTPSNIRRLLSNCRIESRDDVSESSDVRAETSDARSESSASVSSLRHIQPRVVSRRVGVLGRPPREPGRSAGVEGAPLGSSRRAPGALGRPQNTPRRSLGVEEESPRTPRRSMRTCHRTAEDSREPPKTPGERPRTRAERLKSASGSPSTLGRSPITFSRSRITLDRSRSESARSPRTSAGSLSVPWAPRRPPGPHEPSPGGTYLPSSCHARSTLGTAWRASSMNARTLGGGGFGPPCTAWSGVRGQ
jgi:hypothetical protein